jgi:hypothetical protein
MSGIYNGRIYGGTCSAATHGLIYVQYIKVWRATSGQRTPRRAADGRTPQRAADRRTRGGGGATQRMGIHAYAMGEGRTLRSLGVLYRAVAIPARDHARSGRYNYKAKHRHSTSFCWNCFGHSSGRGARIKIPKELSYGNLSA